MKIRYILIFILFPFVVEAQRSYDYSDTAIERRIKKDLYILASDSFGGREAGTDDEIRARDYIVKQFQEIGLMPLMPGDSYVQEFKGKKLSTILQNIKKDTLKQKSSIYYSTYNIIGYIDNGAPHTVVIGAHYDHIGKRQNLSTGKDVVYFGADDNASGIVAVLEIARYLKENGKKNNNYVLCAFSAEEEGLLGASYFVNSPLFKGLSINYMINFDMIGRLGTYGNVCFVNGVASSRVWRKVLKKTTTSDFKIKRIAAGMEGSDDLPFYSHGIPVLYFTTGIHKDYHTNADKPEKINYKGEVSIINYVKLLIDELDSKGKLPFKTVSLNQTIRGLMFYSKMMIRPK